MTTTSTMAATTTTTSAAGRNPAGPVAWTCPNCLRETRAPRKRCVDCGTSRY